jgi:Raf kinase inhibitor-like YbhB/YbcL family protein
LKQRILIIVSILIVVVIVFITAYFLLIPHGTSGKTSGKSGLLPDPIYDLVKDKPGKILVIVDMFSNGSRIPDKYSLKGGDVSPSIKIANIPSNTKSLILIMYDPDAPRGVFYHWLLYNIPYHGEETIIINEGVPKKLIVKYGLQGRNDFGKIGYDGPSPPPGTSHRYVFIVLALNEVLPSGPGNTVPDILVEAKGHVIDYGIYYGYYP